ncbi:MAG: hypothetical protein ABI682_01040 [Acidobacteriota bacterium]
MSMPMIVRRAALLGFAAAAILATRASAQQQPIFGCRHAINCRPSPVSASALNESGRSGLLVSGSVRWGPGFHFGLAMPALNLRARELTPEIDIHAFHLQNVTLLPAPAASSPTPTPSGVQPPR